MIILCPAVTWDESILWCRGRLVLLILPYTMALSLSGPTLRHSISLIPGGPHCRFVGPSAVEFHLLISKSNVRANSVSFNFNVVLFSVPFEFSPCVQGSVSCFAIVFKNPTMIFPDLATLRFLTFEMRHAYLFSHALVFATTVRPLCLGGLDLLSTPASLHLALARVFSIHAQVYFSMHASFSLPRYSIFTRCHLYAFANSHLTTTDTSFNLLLSNLLVTASTSKFFCFNFEWVGASRSLLNFRGSRQFSV